MSSVGLQTLDARRVIEARLAREPQDMLEAAVVLEAWAGLPAQTALDTGRRVMDAATPGAQASVGRVPASSPRRGSLLEALAFLLTTLAIAGWAAPLADDVGAGAVERALMLALPLTLAIQWVLQSRYLGRPGGLIHLGRRRRELVAGACAIVGLPPTLLGVAGVVASMLTLTWVCGTILVRRRWTGAYAACMLLGTAEMYAGLPALPVLAGMTVAAVAAAALALRGRDRAVGSPPGRAGRALLAGAVGAVLGALLVADTSVTWTAGAVPALALVPASVGGFWGGWHLARLAEAIPRAVSGLPVGAREARGLRAAPLRLLAGAVLRLLVAAGGLSAALLLFTPWLGTPAGSASVLAGFGLVALAMLLVGVLVSLGRTPAALACVACAVAVELLVAALGEPSFPGAALLIGSAVAVLLLLPAAVALLRAPARTLATTLWIT